MKQCKHCGSRYRHDQGQGDFCCAGCQHVYAMIQESGLGSYYARQDRAGQPVDGQHLGEVEYVSIKQLQEQAENTSECKVILGVQGMSCLGCAWLIEELARRREGVLLARAALNSSRLCLEWKRGNFNLCQFAEELQNFGYKLSGNAVSGTYAISPLATRFGLTLIFSLNGLLLLLAAVTGLGGPELEQLYRLLMVLCLFFTQLIGGALYLKPAWRGLLLRRLHSDSLPAVIVLALSVLALAELFFLRTGMVFATFYFLLLPCMVFARWLSELWLLNLKR